jgi:hypothetical protein
VLTEVVEDGGVERGADDVALGDVLAHLAPLGLQLLAQVLQVGGRDGRAGAALDLGLPRRLENAGAEGLGEPKRRLAEVPLPDTIQDNCKISMSGSYSTPINPGNHDYLYGSQKIIIECCAATHTHTHTHTQIPISTDRCLLLTVNTGKLKIMSLSS